MSPEDMRRVRKMQKQGRNIRDERDEALARAEAAEAVIERVREFHRRDHTRRPAGFEWVVPWCLGCLDDWPCATVSLLPEVTP